MKIISISDIHGRPYWKEIDVNQYDKVIFVGDYVDSYDRRDVEILTNLEAIIELKKEYPDKVVLLLGNHDIGYMFLNEGYNCSGFRPAMQINLMPLFKLNKDLFQIAFQIGKHIWTHAGISKGWYDYNREDIERIASTFETKDLADTLNHMLHLKENRLLHQVGNYRGGSYQFGGITWADRKETKNDYLPGYFQIVGHTPCDVIMHYGDENGSIRYIDVLGRYEFLEELKQIEKEKFGVKSEYCKEMKKRFPDITEEDFKDIEDKYEITKFYEFELIENGKD